MPKQTIEIDVPDGYEVESVSEQRLHAVFNNPIPAIDVRVTFKKKPPQFIEVREYLYQLSHGKGYRIGVVVRNTNDRSPSDQEEYMGSYFIRWIDHEWRKVEI